MDHKTLIFPALEYKGFSTEKVKPLITSDNSISLKLK